MTDHEILDPLFRQAVSAIDAGDVDTLERLLAEHPRLVRDGTPLDWAQHLERKEIAAYLREKGRRP